MAGLISYRNLIDNATLTNSLGFGDPDPAHPLDNLKLRGLAEYFAMDIGASFSVDAGLGIDGLVHLVALLDLSATGSAGWLSGSFTVWSRYFGGAWVEQASIVASDTTPLASIMSRNVFFAFPEGFAATEVRVTANFAGLDEQPRCGRLWAGPAILLPDGIDAGWSMSFRDTGQLDETSGGQWIESAGARTRVLTIPLEGARATKLMWGFDDDQTIITESDYVESLFGLQMTAGTTGEVIALPRTSTPLWMRNAGVYGHIEQPWSIGHKAGPYWGGSLTIVEER